MEANAMRRMAVAGVLGLGLVANGCKSKPAAVPAQQAVQPGAATQGGVQGTLNPDGTFTPAPGQPGSTAAAPAVAPAPVATTAPAPVTTRTVTPAPVASAPAAPAAPVYRMVPAGTRVAVTITETLSASRNNVGDGFTGVLAEPLVVRGGGTAFSRGTHVSGTVVAAKGRGRFKGAGALGIELTSIGGVRVSSSEYEKEAQGRGKRSAGFIGGGAGLGALIGGLAGGGKGAAIGALAGGGGGTAAAAYTGNRDVVIPSESVVTFRLNSSLSVR